MDKKVQDLLNDFKFFDLITEEDKMRIPKLTAWLGDVFKLSVMEREKREIFPKRGEIWAVDLGENVGAEINKVRPCLIVQNNKGNKHSPTVIIVPISSRKASLPSHLELKPSDILDESNPTVGTLLGEQVRVVSKGRLLEKFTKVKYESMGEIDKMLSVSLGIN